jgi:hypothetical protein
MTKRDPLGAMPNAAMNQRVFPQLRMTDWKAPAPSTLTASASAWIGSTDSSLAFRSSPS